MAKLKETRYIDTNTGEITGGNKVTVDFFNEEGYLLFAKNNYSRVFTDIRIPSDFTDTELGKIYRLQASIQQGTNMLFKRTNGKRRPMTYTELVAEVGLSDRLSKEFVKKLLDYEIIAKVTIETGKNVAIQYYFNPLYFHNSKRLSPLLYNLFKKQIDKHIPGWVKNEYEQIAGAKNNMS